MCISFESSTPISARRTDYKDALKYGFYELQSARDWYREVTSDVLMHVDLVRWWIQTAALLVLPIAPHFAEHIHTTLLHSPTSVQLALWPSPTKPVNQSVIDSGAYMRGTTKTMRDAELGLLKKMQKGKGGKGGGGSVAVYDPKKPKAVRIYVATGFPEWQDRCVQVVKDAYDEERDRVDDVKVRELLTERGMIKDKKAMPFIQAFKVRHLFSLLPYPLQGREKNQMKLILCLREQKRMAQFGAHTAFNRTLPFSELTVLNEFLPYLKRTLNLQDAEVLFVEDSLKRESEPGFTKAIIECAEPGAPAFEYRNV